jgi:hypothetical protein
VNGIDEVCRVIESGVLGSVDDPAFSNLGGFARTNALAAPAPTSCMP